VDAAQSTCFFQVPQPVGALLSCTIMDFIETFLGGAACAPTLGVKHAWDSFCPWVLPLGVICLAMSPTHASTLSLKSSIAPFIIVKRSRRISSPPFFGITFAQLYALSCFKHSCD